MSHASVSGATHSSTSASASASAFASASASGSGSAALVPHTFADRSAIRRIHASQDLRPVPTSDPAGIPAGIPAGTATAVKPLHLSWFEAHFSGQQGHFSHLAQFRQRHPQPPLSPSAARSLQRVIEFGAHMRVAVIRDASLCAHCSHLSPAAPFCAMPPYHIQPAGTRQHANSKSKRCLLHRTFNSLCATPERIRLLLADEQGQLRVVRDTDDRGKPMLMLDEYAVALWNAVHVLGTAAVLADVEVVLQAHGLLPITTTTRTQPREHVDDLVDQFAALAASAATPTRPDDVQRLARLHVGIFGADAADYTMQAIMVALIQKIDSSAPTLAPPQHWLVQAAVRAHAQYEPDKYTAADGSVVRVSRDHTRAQHMFTQWLERTFANAAANAPNLVPARCPRPDDKDPGPRPARKRARARIVLESHDDMHLDSDQDQVDRDQVDRDQVDRDQVENEADMELNSHVQWMDDAMDRDSGTPRPSSRELEPMEPIIQALGFLVDTSMSTASDHDHDHDAFTPAFVADERADDAADAMLIDAARPLPCPTAIATATTTATMTAKPSHGVRAQRWRRNRRQSLMAVAAPAAAASVVVAVFALGFCLGRRSSYAHMAHLGAHFVSNNRREI